MKLNLKNNYKDIFLSERLRFTIINENDNELLFNIINSNITKYWIGWEPCKSVEENKKWLNKKLKVIEEDIGIEFLIHDFENNFIGSAGFEVDGIHFGITIWIVENMWGKGYGEEIIKTMIKWSKNHTGLNKILYSYTDGNERSKKLLNKFKHTFYEKVLEEKDGKKVFVYNSLIEI